MPPKRKNKKNKKPSTVPEALPTQEESKDQLWEKALGLQEELQSVRKEKNLFKLEKDKNQEVWETSEKNLEESELLLKTKIRAKMKAEERRRVEITVYKQKLKHVLSEQNNGVFEVRKGAASSSSLVQNQNTRAELDLRREIQNLQADCREKKLQEHGSMKLLKLNHQAQLMKLSYEHEVRMREMEEQKLWTIQSAAEVQQKKEAKALADNGTQRKHLSTLLMTENQKKLKKIEGTLDEFKEATENRFFFCKEDLRRLKKEEVKWERNMSAAEQENQRLKESLQEVQQKIPELRRQLQECRLSRASVERSRADKELLEKELRDVTVEHQLLLQASHKLQEERDRLLRSQTESLLEVQQRSGLKKMLLHSKMAALSRALEEQEQEEAQLSAALCRGEPRRSSHAAARLTEVLESRRSSLEVLQQDLDQEDQEDQEDQQLKASGPEQENQ